LTEHSAAAILPVEVVMRLGLMPQQKRALDKAFRKARAFDRFRVRTRRSFLALGVLSIGGAAAAFVVGRASAPAAAGEPAGTRDAWIDGLARGPLAALRAQAPHVVAALESCAPDDPLWIAFHRLAEIAIANPADETLRRQLRKLGARDNAPPSARESAAHFAGPSPR
jgi:hypothetical protein